MWETVHEDKSNILLHFIRSYLCSNCFGTLKVLFAKDVLESLSSLNSCIESCFVPFWGREGHNLSLYFLFIYFWLHWVFIAACRISLVAVSRGYSFLWCAGFSLWCPLLLRSTGSGHVGFSRCGMRAQ